MNVRGVELLLVGCALLTGCGGSSKATPTTVNLDDHAGIFLTQASENSRSLIAVVRLNPCPPLSYISGNTYATLADAQEAMADDYAAWGTDTGNPTSTIRGQLAYSDTRASTHANQLNITIQFSDANNKWTLPAETGTAYFDGKGNLIETAADSASTPTPMNGTWTPVSGD